MSNSEGRVWLLKAGPFAPLGNARFWKRGQKKIGGLCARDAQMADGMANGSGRLEKSAVRCLEGAVASEAWLEEIRYGLGDFR